MTSLVLGQNIPLYHTYNQETQDTKFAIKEPVSQSGRATAGQSQKTRII